MTIQINREERDLLLKSLQEARDDYNASKLLALVCPPWSKKEEETLAEARAFLEKVTQLEKDYFDALPQVIMGCCPFDGKLLSRSFDPFGFDGPWWRSDTVLDEAPPCRHFCLTTGAVTIGDAEVQGGDFDAHIGPGAPYLIPRLLALPGMVAVIGRLKMDNGCTAYPISYFAEVRPSHELLGPEWRRNYFVYTDPAGEHRWRLPKDHWDFELLEAIKSRKARWCPPESDNTWINQSDAYSCPYVGLPGERRPLVVTGSQVRFSILPELRVRPSLCL